MTAGLCKHLHRKSWIGWERRVKNSSLISPTLRRSCTTWIRRTRIAGRTLSSCSSLREEHRDWKSAENKIMDIPTCGPCCSCCATFEIHRPKAPLVTQVLINSPYSSPATVHVFPQPQFRPTHTATSTTLQSEESCRRRTHPAVMDSWGGRPWGGCSCNKPAPRVSNCATLGFPRPPNASYGQSRLQSPAALPFTP
jgi:hypothetical protein